MDCAGNGDYKALQAADDKNFCVDSDGYPTTKIGDITQCPVFPNNNAGEQGNCLDDFKYQTMTNKNYQIL